MQWRIQRGPGVGTPLFWMISEFEWGHVGVPPPPCPGLGTTIYKMAGSAPVVHCQAKQTFVATETDS